MEVREYVPLAEYTTFNIGGPARYFVDAHSLSDIKQASALATQLALPVCVLGGGSNMLVNDNGFRGVVIRIAMSHITLEHSGVVHAGAGVVLKELIMYSAEHGLGGCAGMYGIPGTLGGAVRGNAGAFGSEIKDVCRGVHAWNSLTNEEKMFSVSECSFGYRTSFFKTHPEWVVLEATLQLDEMEAEKAIAACNATFEERTKRQIQHIKSAGSFFMNPIVPQALQNTFETEKGTKSREDRVPAGWLIERAGLQGLSEGSVQTGARSANYLINAGGATAEEVRATAQRIYDAVYKQSGVTLTPEVAYVDIDGYAPVLHSPTS